MILPERFSTTSVIEQANESGSLAAFLPDAQTGPSPGKHRSARVVEFNLYEPPHYLRDILPTLAELEAFCRRARADGAPDEALVRGLGTEPVVVWYVSDDAPDVELQPAHLIDSEGDVWVETSEDEFCIAEPRTP